MSCYQHVRSEAFPIVCISGAEYATWLEQNGGSVSGTGGSGTGAEGDEVKCEEGYVLDVVDGKRTCKGEFMWS